MQLPHCVSWSVKVSVRRRGIDVRPSHKTMSSKWSLVFCAFCFVFLLFFCCCFFVFFCECFHNVFVCNWQELRGAGG